MGQLGIRIINIALFTTACFFGAGIVNHVAESQLAPDYVAAFQPVARAEARQPDWKERSAILDRNLFGAKVAGADEVKPVAPPPPPEEEAQATKLPLELLGTMAGDPASISTAVINNTRQKKHQAVRIGDTLKDYDYVKVTSIEPGRVLLRNRSVTEELLLDKDAVKARSSSRAEPRAARTGRGPLQRLRDRRARQRSSRRQAPEAPAAEEADPEEDARLNQIQGAMAKNLIRDLEPAYDDEGQISGVLVGDIEPNSILARAGLEADDVIESLNGINIDSAGAAARVLREMSKCKPMTGSIRGAAGSRPIEIPESLLAEMNCTN